MTDENLSVDSVSTDGSSGDVSQQNQSASPEPVTTQAETGNEKLFTQNDVNNMSGAVRRKGYEQGLKAGRTENQPETQSQYGASELDESKVNELINARIAESGRQQQEKFESERFKSEADRVTAELVKKMTAAKETIPDFDEVMQSVDYFDTSPEIAYAVHSMDNAGEVMYHLASNGKDFAAMTLLAQKTPKAAERELRKISDRLKQNENAKKSTHAPNPISQIETTIRDGIGDATPRSVSDYRATDMCKG